MKIGTKMQPLSLPLVRLLVFLLLPNCSVCLLVTLKIAVDRNGGVADKYEKPERFTCPKSLDMVHRLRSISDAVLVGRATAEVDDPSLLVRRGFSVDRQPLRVVLDPACHVLDAKECEPDSDEKRRYDLQLLTDDERTLIYHTADFDKECLDEIGKNNEMVQLPCPMNVADVLEDLETNWGVRHLMVEGGARTAQAFLDAKAVDQCALVVAKSVEFEHPIPSGITGKVLEDAGLTKFGVVGSGVDDIECWAKCGDEWPSFSFVY